MFKNKKLFFGFLLFFGLVLVLPEAAQAQGLQYTLLERIPGTENVGSDLKSHLEALYRLALVLVVLAAVLMISIGGFLYLTSAGNTAQMGTAKSIIFDALIGLVIALVAWLVLYVINPDLANPTVPTLTSQAPASAGTVTPPPTPGTGTPGTCGGLTPQAGINCADASGALADILSCMKQRGVTTTVSSISDSKKGFEYCKNSWDTSCAHAKNSCHYGGGAAKTAPECQKSLAADLSVKNSRGAYDQSIANAIMAAARACGARINDETQKKGVPPHIHISAPTNCCSL